MGNNAVADRTARASATPLRDRNGRLLGGMYNKQAEMPAPQHWLVYARVPVVHKGAVVVRSLGGKVLNGPIRV